MIPKGISWQYRWGTPFALGDKLSSNNGVMMDVRRWAWPQAPIIKSSHCPQRWKKPSSSSNPLSDITIQEHVKILLRILSTLQITLQFLLREYALYEFVETNTFSVRTLEGCLNLPQSHYILQWAWFHQQLLSTFQLGHYQTGWIRGVQVYYYQCVALRRVVRRATLDRWGRLVRPYCWRNKILSLGRQGVLDKEIVGCMLTNKYCIDYWDLRYPCNNSQCIQICPAYYLGDESSWKQHHR